ncbi:hypothetical protein ACE6H2_007567 [Prunus campanulata]
MNIFIVVSGYGGSGHALTQAANLRFLLDVSIVIVNGYEELGWCFEVNRRVRICSLEPGGLPIANGLLTADKHCIGRTVDDVRFQIESTAVSGRQCQRTTKHPLAFLTDLTLSTNGTYLNWKKLTKGGLEAGVRHGDNYITFCPSSAW